MLDFYFLIHYVLYRHYRRHGEDELSSLIAACSIQGTLLGILAVSIMYYAFLLLNRNFSFSDISIKIGAIAYTIMFLGFEYFIFYRNELYKEVFDEFLKESDTPVMQKKFKQAKIFNWSILIMDIIMLCIGDYINHHKL